MSSSRILRANLVLRQAREHKGWSQEQVAAFLDTNAFTVYRWESGRASPSPYYRQKLCDLFEMNGRELGVLPTDFAPPKGSQDQFYEAEITEEMREHTSFSEMLKAFRKERKITQKQLAERLDTHFNTISMWERGSYLPESKGIVLEIARQLALNKNQTRQLLEASLTALPPYWNVPHQRNSFFTGRETVLQNLYKVLHQEDAMMVTRSCALSGLGGIGKTQIATEYAYHNFQKYSAVFWIHAETYEGIASSYVSIAHVLKLPESQTEKQDEVVAAVIQWLNKHRDWLLIIDNLVDIGLVTSLLPTARKGSLLFTTQMSTLGILAECIKVEPMTHLEGAHFLLHRIRHVGLKPSHKELKDAIQLATVMGGLPLALDQAGAYIEETNCSISDYLELYYQHFAYLLQHRGKVIFEHPESIYSTLLLCFEKIQQSTPLAIELLHLCVFLYPDTIPEDLVNEIATLSSSPLASLANDPLQYNKAISELLTYSLLHRNPHAKTLSIHRLVQDVLKDLMQPESLALWSKRAVQAVNNRFPDSRIFTNWPDCHEYLPHAQLCTVHIEKYQLIFPEAAHLLLQTGIYLLQQAQYTQAERLLLQSLDMYQHKLQGEHLKVTDCLNNLAILYHMFGKYTQAEPLLQEALSIRQRFLGVEHQDCAEILNNLSTISFYQEIYSQAEEYCQQATAIWIKNLGPDHPDVAVSLNNLAGIYLAQEKYTQAETLLLQADAIWKKALGKQHPTVAFAAANLAKLYQKQGKLSQARKLLRKALVIREMALGSTHPRVARSLLELASLYQSEGKYSLAVPLYKRSVAIFKETFGLDHHDTVMATEQLAVCLQANKSSFQNKFPYSEANIQE